MLTSLKEAIAGFAKMFGGLPTGKKIAMASAAVFMLTGVLLTSYFASRNDYSVLYGNLSQDDMLSITQKLKERNILYKLGRDGSAVSVPVKDVYQLRLELAGEGLPLGGGVGFEIFDKSTFGMTEFVQKLNMRRALQGELQRTINSLTAVRSSRVHIALPRKTLFEDEDSMARASIVLNVIHGNGLSKPQVEGIAHLVASAVEGLKSSAVTIVDSGGNILRSSSDDSSAAILSANQMEYQHAYESGMEKRLRTMLERVVGIGRAIVRVNAAINFKQEQRTEEIYDPDSQVARSEQRLEEKNIGATLTGGVAGVQSNLPEGAGKRSAQGKPARSSSVNETVNYEINKVIKTVIEPANVVKKLSVAVLVDGKYETRQNDEGETVREFRLMNDEEKSGLERLVRTAIGFTQTRQDSVIIESIQFDILPEMEGTEMTSSITQKDTLNNVMRFAGLAMAGIFVFLFLLRPVMGWISSSAEEMEELKTVPQTIAQMEQELGESEKPKTDSTFRSKIGEVVKENPDQVAELVRAWLRNR